MKKIRVVSVGFVAGALALAPMSSALAGGAHWSHGSSHHGGYHGGGYHVAYGHAGGGYWYGGVWWPVAAAAAVVGTAAALVAAPFVAIGNAVAYSTYVPPSAPAPYYAPQQQYYAPQGYAPQGYAPQGYAPQGYAPQGYAPQGYAPQDAPQGYSAPQHESSVAPDHYAQRAPQQYSNNARPAPTDTPPQGYYEPPATYDAPTYDPSVYRQRAAAPVSYTYYNAR